MIANFGDTRVEYKRDTYRKEYFTVPINGTFGQIKFDWELLEYDFAPRPMLYPIPAVYSKGVKTIYDDRVYDYVPLPRDWQFAIAVYLRWASDELLSNASIITAYKSLVARSRAFTDAYPPEAGGADYVTGRNIGNRPYEWLCRTCHGNMVKIIGEAGQYYVVEAMDVLGPPPAPKPWLIHWATEITPRGVVSGFPQLEVECIKNGFSPVGTPIPFLSRGGTVKVLKRHIRILTAGEKFSPYGRM